MKLIIKIALGIILALVLLVAGCGALVAASADEIEKEVATQTSRPARGTAPTTRRARTVRRSRTGCSPRRT